MRAGRTGHVGQTEGMRLGGYSLCVGDGQSQETLERKRERRNRGKRYRHLEDLTHGRRGHMELRLMLFPEEFSNRNVLVRLGRQPIVLFKR